MPINKLMKTIVILFDNESSYENEKVFNGKSAKELCIKNTEALGYEIKILNKKNTVCELLQGMQQICEETKADSVIFSFTDFPFINKKLTEELIQTHLEYKAEYTFAEGYPLGFSPEILDKGTINILSELCRTTAASTGNQKITKQSIFEVLKTDINAFEIETVLAPIDWRLLRLSFTCDKKENLIACKELYKICKSMKVEDENLNSCDAVELSNKAAESVEILKTVPAYYNLQLAQKCRGKCSYCPYPKCCENKTGKNPAEATEYMPTEKAFALVEKIAEFSAEAVIGLSAWGEAFNHPDLLKIIEKILSFSGLSVVIEADGSSVPGDFAEKLSVILEKAENRTNGWNKLMFIVSMDGFTEQTCKNLRGEEFSLQKAVDSVIQLEKILPGSVYPQFVRMNQNEEELEPFFRYWKEKTNGSCGELIIQKHNNFAGLLENQEPADLSPLDRNVCWHLRRDMTVLANGNVPMCYSCVLENIIGNVFENSLEEVWAGLNKEVEAQINGKYCKKCEVCNEFYTFNF